jgi:hypothetical protein
MYKLLATSALVAAGLWGMTEAASAQAKVAPITVSVGGYHEQTFGYAKNNKDVNYAATPGAPSAITVGGVPLAPAGGVQSRPNSLSNQSDAEIWFQGVTTLNNGLRVGFDVQLEAGSNNYRGSALAGGDQIDEAYIFVDGAFGRFLIGSENDASYLMHVSAPTAGRSLGMNESATANWIRRPAAVTFLDTTSSSQTNDAQRLTYFTPRYAGFQGGISFTPNTTVEDFNGFDDKRAARTNSVAAALNYTNTIGGVSIQASLGIHHLPKVDAALVNTAEANAIKDYSGGVQLGFGGFAVGGGYRKVDAERSAIDGEAYGFGVSYTMGPFSVGLSHLTSKAEGTFNNTSDDKVEQLLLSAAYTMGPGVDLIGAIFNMKYEDEGGLAANENKGTAAVGGIRLTF